MKATHLLVSLTLCLLMMLSLAPTSNPSSSVSEYDCDFGEGIILAEYRENLGMDMGRLTLSWEEEDGETYDAEYMCIYSSISEAEDDFSFFGFDSFEFGHAPDYGVRMYLPNNWQVGSYVLGTPSGEGFFFTHFDCGNKGDTLAINNDAYAIVSEPNIYHGAFSPEGASSGEDAWVQVNLTVREKGRIEGTIEMRLSVPDGDTSETLHLRGTFAYNDPPSYKYPELVEAVEVIEAEPSETDLVEVVEVIEAEPSE